MARKPTGNPNGRPKKEIDRKIFEKMCGCWCTEEEICATLDVTDKTLTRWCHDTYGVGFSDIYKQKSLAGTASLRAKQLAVALQGNVTMLIFLGKNKLGQTDKQEVTAAVISDETRQAVDDLVRELDEEETENDD